MGLFFCTPGVTLHVCVSGFLYPGFQLKIQFALRVAEFKWRFMDISHK